MRKFLHAVCDFAALYVALTVNPIVGVVMFFVVGSLFDNYR